MVAFMTDEPEKPVTDNETIRAVKRAKAGKEAAEKTSMGWKTAAGIGIGSAALAAAVIYANRALKKDDD